jgi:hypothetical protein
MSKMNVEPIDLEKLSGADIKRRGWTDAMIAQLLGDPDERQPNPHYPDTGAPMRLYLRRRVEQAEATPKFEQWLNRIRARRELHAAVH